MVLRDSHLDFKPCLDDPDFWMMLAIKSDGVLLYPDDSLVVSGNSESMLRNETCK